MLHILHIHTTNGNKAAKHFAINAQSETIQLHLYSDLLTHHTNAEKMAIYNTVDTSFGPECIYILFVYKIQNLKCGNSCIP